MIAIDKSVSIVQRFRQLQAELAALEYDWNVGNYLERVDIINQKRAELAALQGV